MGIFGAAHRLVEGGGAKMIPLPKIFHTYSTMMKFGTAIRQIKKIQKVFGSCEIPLSSASHWELASFVY